MKTIALIPFIWLFFLTVCPAQSNKLIDSLQMALQLAKVDTEKVDILNNLADNYKYINPDSTIFFAAEALDLANGIIDIERKSIANIYLAQGYIMKGDFEKASEISKSGLDMTNEALGGSMDTSTHRYLINLKSTHLSNLGICNSYLGFYPAALKYYLEVLKILELLGSEANMAGTLHNIGDIYLNQKNYQEALNYLNRALAINEKYNNLRWKANNIIEIGMVYQSMNNYSKSMEYNKEAREIYEQLDDNYGLAIAIEAIGEAYLNMGNLDEALKIYQTALQMNVDVGNTHDMTASHIQLGIIYTKKKNYTAAAGNLKKGLELAQATKNLEHLKIVSLALSRLDSILGNPAGSLRHYKDYITFRDSLYNEENTKKIVQTQMQYEFDKKEALNKADQEKRDALVAEELQRQKLLRNSFFAGFSVVLLFAGVFFRQRNSVAKAKKRSDELLLNILPEEVAEELKQKGHANAKLIDDVTVLFTDIIGFTRLTETMAPEELVASIHVCFSEFDRITEKYGLEKIKTIGDAYMAAGGLPTPNATHAFDVVNAALDMQAYVSEMARDKQEKGEPYFEIRLGVHTGPVVAGIVGIKKFSYDIWGDTVNIAARMESSGEAGKVNISQTTYSIVKDQFSCRHRGKIDAKNKGEVDMYFVERISDGL